MTTAGPGTCPADASFDPLSPEFLADPYVVMAALRLEEMPVFFAPSIGYYVVTRYADIQQVFRDPATYSVAVAQAPLAPLVAEAQQVLLAGGHKPQPSMVSLDEPAHARLRKPAARAFSMKRVNAMIPAIEATTARLLDSVGGLTEFEMAENQNLAGMIYTVGTQELGRGPSGPATAYGGTGTGSMCQMSRQ